MSHPSPMDATNVPGKPDALAQTVRPGATPESASAGGELRRLTAETGRYALAASLGAGATSEVHSAQDRIFQREVAIKILSTGDQGTTERFIHAARLTARLEHPSIIPVYDLDWPIGSGARLVMRRVVGISLGAAIRQAEQGTPPAQISDVNRIITIILKICDALALAHSREVIHRDLKPDNILLGEWGEVMVVDWGEASELHEEGSGSRRVVGTPTYMSPEQADGAHVADARSDVYCLGATLFHALYLRPPLHDHDIERFWQRKRAGLLELPTPAEERRVPRRLSAIVRRTLVADPAGRYQSISALADDLRRFQAGQAVQAYHESRLETVARWLHRHASVLAVVVLVMVSLGGAVAVVWGERLKEIATWGNPVFTDDFTEDSWRGRWAVHLGSFTRQDGKLVSAGKNASVLMCRQRFSGATAIEFTGEALPNSHLCDLSVWWCRDIEFSADGSRALKLNGLYKLQVGAYDNSYSAIILSDERQVASSPFTITHGKHYRIRAEISDNRIRLLVDGRLLCEYVDAFPLSSGYVGLYGYYPGKAFSQVRVHALGVPEKLPATAIGDAFANQQFFPQAAEQYARVVATHPGTRLGREALYKQGLCLLRSGRSDEAFAIWAPLEHSDLADEVALHRLDRSFANGAHTEVTGMITDLARRGRSEIRTQLALRWATYAYDLMKTVDPGTRRTLLGEYLRVHDQELIELEVADRAAAECLLLLDRVTELLVRYPAQRHCCARGLFNQGRLIDVVRGYPDQSQFWQRACTSTGSFSELIAQSDDPDWTAIGKIQLGRGEEVVGDRSLPPHLIGEALVSLGRFTEALAIPDLRPDLVALSLIGLGWAAELSDERLRPLALMALGQPRAVLDHQPPYEENDQQWARAALGLEAFIAGDPTASRTWFMRQGGEPRGELSFTFAVIEPLLREESGDVGALDRRCAVITANQRYLDAQRPWYAARFLRGEINESVFLDQPSRLSARAWLLACNGVKAERGKNPAAAVSAYRGYLALPPNRHGAAIDPLMDHFVAWRLTRLTGDGRPAATP